LSNIDLFRSVKPKYVLNLVTTDLSIIARKTFANHPKKGHFSLNATESAFRRLHAGGGTSGSYFRKCNDSPGNPPGPASPVRADFPDAFGGRMTVADRCRPVGVKPTETKVLQKIALVERRRSPRSVPKRPQIVLETLGKPFSPQISSCSGSSSTTPGATAQLYTLSQVSKTVGHSSCGPCGRYS